ncbi:calcineurin B-like protein 8 [Prunus dulcis]|uniref:Calcineurin B-like protein 8 n=1 Tax=Prunus dulcis TaxID=3755 RepID=A0A4Y1RT25_PRUDU|nr:calcineurin B-like protein 8 [Prunus dulcis]
MVPYTCPFESIDCCFGYWVDNTYELMDPYTQYIVLELRTIYRTLRGLLSHSPLFMVLRVKLEYMFYLVRRLFDSNHLEAVYDLILSEVWLDHLDMVSYLVSSLTAYSTKSTHNCRFNIIQARKNSNLHYFKAAVFDLFDIKRKFGEFVRSLSIFHPNASKAEKI